MTRAPLLCLLIALSAALTAAEPVAITDAKDQVVMQGFLTQVAQLPERLSADYCRKLAAEEAEGYTWKITPNLMMAVEAYQLTGDSKYLDLFVQVFANLRAAMIAGPDGFLDWYGIPYPVAQDPAHPDTKVDIIINGFRVSECLLDFIIEARGTPALAAKYQKPCAEYLELIENHLVKCWLARGKYTDLGARGAVFRQEDGLKPETIDLTMPNNKHAIVVHCLTTLYRVTGKDDYLRMAVKIGTRFKHCLTLRDGHYEWNYWDPAGAWDIHPVEHGKWKHWIGVEHKGGYYAASLSQAIALYHFGLVFDRVDLDRFLKTQLSMCWNGSMTDPQWSRCDGTRSDKYMLGNYMCMALAPFSKAVAEFEFQGPRQEFRVKSVKHDWDGGPIAGEWLVGKYVDEPAARDQRQVHLAFGQRFLAKTENAELIKNLAFTVEEPGYHAPKVPAEMKDMPTLPAK